MTEVSSHAALQNALDAVATAEPNVPGGTVPNRSRPILCRGLIELDDQLQVPGNAMLIGAAGGGGISWDEETFPIVYYSATGNGATARIIHDGLTIYAPNAIAAWGWDFDNHAGNATKYEYRGMKITVAGVHLNCGAPGDGGFYNPVFDDIECYGVGQMVGGIDSDNAVTDGGTPVLGRFVDVKYSGITCAYDYVVNVASASPSRPAEATFTNCHVEPTSAGFVKTVGASGFLRWDSYNELHGTFTDPKWYFSGANNRVITDALHFLQPTVKAQLAGGAKLIFRGSDIGISNSGVAIDFTTLTGSSTADLQTIRDSFVIDSSSSVQWPGGFVKSTGVTLYDKTAV